jgi:transposase
MLGKRSAQRGLFEGDYLYGEFVGRETFYGFLASQRGTLFQDDDFAQLYCVANGRPSVPPSLLATALVLQTYDGVSDEEAVRRAAFDLQWKVAFGIELTTRPFAKSTLQEFRARLLLHEEVQALFRASLTAAKRHGFLRKNRKLRVALDTTNILGRGAVKDTYYLLADGIVAVLRVLARQAEQALVAYATAQGLEPYVSGSSLKGQVEIDWSHARARREVLQAIVADADRLLEVVRDVRMTLEPGSAVETALVEAAGVLSRVLDQDIERRRDGAALREGVAADRLVSVHDPEQRHGRKSASKRFNGHKAGLAVDPAEQWITATTVVAGNAPDAAVALALVEQTEANTDGSVAEALGDCAFGDGKTRQAFADAGRTLRAKVPAAPTRGRLGKADFTLDLDAETCRCPAGQATEMLRTRPNGDQYFQFPAAVCQACPLREQCVTGTGGRVIPVHPQEPLLQAARAFQASPDFAEFRTDRQAVEHRIARLVQLGIRQARYVGRKKTAFQLALAATVANLTLLAGRVAARSLPVVDEPVLAVAA